MRPCIDNEFNLRLMSVDPSIQALTQKCIVPSEKFPKGFAPGSLCLCSVYNHDYVCFLFPMNNKYPSRFYSLDKSVHIKRHSESKIKGSFELLSIKMLENDVKPFGMISVKVILNRAIFDKITSVTRSKLVHALKTFLTLYAFTKGSVIEMHDASKVFGIETIEILSAQCESVVGYVEEKTELIIEDIKYVESASWLKSKTLIGVDHVIEYLNRIAKELNVRTKRFDFNFRPSSNTLIVGAAGCGKTAICKSFLFKNECNVFEIHSNDILRSLPGDTEAELKNVFSVIKYFVKELEPKRLTVLMIENIDLLCPADKKTFTEKSHTARVYGQLISLLDELYDSGIEVLVLATTLNLESIHSDIRTSSRFENEILIHSPNEKQRQDILLLLLKQIKFFGDEATLDNLAKWIASRTPGYVAADLVMIVSNARRVVYDAEKKPFEFCKNVFANALRMIKPISLRGIDVRRVSSDLRFNHIGGMNSLKKSLNTAVINSQNNPQAFRRFGLQPPKGILLYGPPGCAKTMIAKGLANEANMALISTSGAEVYSPYVGDAEKFILKIFNVARKNAPCLIFFDEIDALIGNRQNNGTTSDVQTRVLSILLTEMDGIGMKVQSLTGPSGSQILIVGATNRPDAIDNALMRPGRFDRLIHVPAPDFLSRYQILETFITEMPMAKDIDLEEIARKTINFSGADLCNLCNEAALHAITRNMDVEFVTKSDFESVLTEIMPSLTAEQIDWYINFEKKHICT